MKPGDLVIGRSTKYFSVVREPVPGAIGLVIEVPRDNDWVRVLYDGRIHTYFQSELQVLGEKEGEDQDCVLQGK